MTVFGVRDGVDLDVITLERFDEGFCHSVGLRAADRRRARLSIPMCISRHSRTDPEDAPLKAARYIPSVAAICGLHHRALE